MNVFVIHSNSDNSVIKNYLNEIAEAENNFELLLLEDTVEKDWKAPALEKIKQADCALYFVGEKSAESENIDWELEQFITMEKPIYTARLNQENSYNPILYRKTTFGNKEYIHDKKQFMYSEEVSLQNLPEDLAAKIEGNIQYSLFDKNRDYSMEELLEQYKTYLQTSETLVARRQSVSNFYITVNSTLISILTAIVALINVFGNEYFKVTTIVCCFIISILGSALCFNWRRVIISYGRLNSAKMQVIQSIESRLPCNIYETEWKTQSFSLGKEKYISFTNIEKKIPVLFLCIYGLVFVVGVALLIYTLIAG